jgi:hypothetical protein
VAGLADVVTVLLPWGSLLRAVAGPDPAALARLAALLKPQGELAVVFGYQAGIDDRAMLGAALPDLRAPDVREALVEGYRRARFAATVREVPVAEVRGLPTTWAKKLSFGGQPRPFVEVRARR